MQEQVVSIKTSLSAEETIVRAVQFFSTEKWRATSQSSRTVTFEGKPPIPWTLLLLTFLGFALCIVPGVVLYVTLIQKMNRFHNLVVAASPLSGGAEIVVTCPKNAQKLTERFLGTLPPLEEDELLDSADQVDAHQIEVSRDVE